MGIKDNIRKKLIGTFGILLSIVILWYLSGRVNFKSSWEQISHIPFYYFLALPTIYLLTFLWRGLRWQYMLLDEGKVPFIKVLNSVVIGFAGNNVLPARGGELVRMEYFRNHTGKSRVMALSSVLAERILDGVCLLFFLGFGGLMASTNILAIPWFQNLFALVFFLFGGAVLFLVLMAFKGAWLITLLNRQDKPLWKKIGQLLEKIANALLFLRSGKRLIGVMVLGVIIWLTEGSMFGIALHAAGVSESVLLAGYICLAVVNFGLLVPSSPAYVGVFQGMTILALTLFAIPEPTALTVGILVHICQFLPITLWGLGIFLVESWQKAT